MKTVGIITNFKKDRYLALTKEIIEYLDERDVRVTVEKRPSELSEKYDVIDEVTGPDTDFFVVIGGDGTILKALSQIVRYEKPILGINLGKVGFLANVEKKDWKKYLDLALDEKYRVDDRMLMNVFDEKNNFLGFALNDTVLFRKNHYGVAEFKVYINDLMFADYLSDGIIVAAPTGSTAYNLSAGGPVVNPNCSVLIINPICAHTLNNTSIVVDRKDVVRISFDRKITTAYIDSEEKEFEGSELTIKASRSMARFIRFEDYNFYSLLAGKIKNPIVKE